MLITGDTLCYIYKLKNNNHPQKKTTSINDNNKHRFNSLFAKLVKAEIIYLQSFMYWLYEMKSIQSHRYLQVKNEEPELLKQNRNVDIKVFVLR